FEASLGTAGGRDGTLGAGAHPSGSGVLLPGLVPPNNAVISVAGDVNTDQVVKALDEKLAGWKAKPVPSLRLPGLPGLAARSVSTLEVSGATQSQIWVGGRLFPANHRDALPVQVGNLILGGLFTSRLNRNLREDKGYSYGVFSITTLGPTTG